MLFLVAVLAVCLGAQQLATTVYAQAPTLTQQLPVDPQITIGKFPNGLRYYIRANKKPEKRAELRLVIKAGSVLEDDDQQGLAHFVEHMAFNGTKHFPKHELVQFIESLGMRFGADLNAYTTFDETVYMLEVPTDKPETMARAMLILEDWAHRVTLDPAEIEKERGVIMEEWRLGRGAQARINDKLFPLLLKGSRYANRLPIGKPEVIQGAKPERLKKFYTDWYRPDLMAVVAVGDFDKAAVEKLITAHFASIPPASSPRPRPTHEITDRRGTLYAIATDKEMTSTSVGLTNILPLRTPGSVGTYRQQIVDHLFSGMLDARFAELTQKPDAPFLFAGSGRGIFLGRTKEAASLNAQVKDDGIERGLEALLLEAERVSRFGFTATELDREKQNLLRYYEQAATEKENVESGTRAAEYIRNFLENEALPSLDDEYALHQRFLPQITVDEVNKLAKEWFPEANRLVVVTAPEKIGLAVPDELKLAAVIKSASTRELKPFVDMAGGTTLLEPLPTPGSIAKTTTKDVIGITEWELSNGLKVVLKPTNFKEDEILFRATSPGGTSLASDKDFIPASSAAQVVAAGGAGKFSAIDLQKVLAGKVASAGPHIGELEEGLSGGSSRKDLETMFQLIYLRFVQPRADAIVFAAQVEQMRAFLANQAAMPEYAFSETLITALFQNHLRRRLWTPATLEELSLDKSLAFYKERFADASDFTFTFVGSFDLATIKPLVERYLGALPSIQRKESWKDVRVQTPKSVVEKKVEKGIEPKSQSAIVFSGPFEFEQNNNVAFRAMTQVLETRLLERLREDLGGTYSITVSPDYQKIPRPEYSVSIQFGSDPQRTEELVKRVFQEIELLKTNGPTEKQLNDVKEALVREFETSSKQNNYLLSQISLRNQIGEGAESLWQLPERYKKLDAATIKETAKKYLNTNAVVKVMLFPEKK